VIRNPRKWDTTDNRKPLEQPVQEPAGFELGSQPSKNRLLSNLRLRKIACVPQGDKNARQSWWSKSFNAHDYDYCDRSSKTRHGSPVLSPPVGTAREQAYLPEGHKHSSLAPILRAHTNATPITVRRTNALWNYCNWSRNVVSKLYELCGSPHYRNLHQQLEVNE